MDPNMIVMLFFAFIAFLLGCYYWKKAQVSRYEYLDLLTFDWKEDTEIMDEMATLKRGWIDFDEFHDHMLAIVQEGLAECDARVIEIDGEPVDRYRYRLTSEGDDTRRRKKKDYEPLGLFPAHT